MLTPLLTVLIAIVRIHRPVNILQSENTISMRSKQYAAELISGVCDCFNAKQHVS